MKVKLLILGCLVCPIQASLTRMYTLVESNESFTTVADGSMTLPQCESLQFTFTSSSNTSLLLLSNNYPVVSVQTNSSQEAVPIPFAVNSNFTVLAMDSQHRLLGIRGPFLVTEGSEVCPEFSHPVTSEGEQNDDETIRLQLKSKSSGLGVRIVGASLGMYHIHFMGKNREKTGHIYRYGEYIPSKSQSLHVDPDWLPFSLDDPFYVWATQANSTRSSIVYEHTISSYSLSSPPVRIVVAGVLVAVVILVFCFVAYFCWFVPRYRSRDSVSSNHQRMMEEIRNCSSNSSLQQGDPPPSYQQNSRSRLPNYGV